MDCFLLPFYEGAAVDVWAEGEGNDVKMVVSKVLELVNLVNSKTQNTHWTSTSSSSEISNLSHLVKAVHKRVQGEKKRDRS